MAVQDESVIGVVRERAGESYRVDIGTSQPATLSMLAFEGATKRNRPNLRVRSGGRRRSCGRALRCVQCH